MLQFAPSAGWSALANAMAQTERLDVRLGARVISLRQESDRIRAGLESGGEVEAAAAVVAMPVNVLPFLDFDPELPPRTAEALGSNAGRALKLWLRASGVPRGVLAAGAGEGLHWLLADRELDGDTLLIAFGYAYPSFDPANRDHVAGSLTAFFPEATLVAWDWHDWNSDASSLGTWATAPVGHAELLDPERFPPHGRIVFATSDVAPREAGWIEGALIAGAHAARSLLSERSPRA
jgi:monoamine oxidase